MNISLLLLVPAIITGFLAGWILKIMILKRLPAIFRSFAPAMAANVFKSGNLQALVSAKGNFESIRPLAEEHIDDFLGNKLGKEMPMIGMFIGEKTIAQLKTIFMKELEDIFPLVINKYLDNLSGEMQQQTLVAQPFSSVSDAQLRSIMGSAFRKHINIFPFWGAFTGLIIGTLQLFLLFMLE